MNAPTILEVMDRCAGWFTGESWATWRVVLKALFALPMTEAELTLFQRYTGRTTPSTSPAWEAWLAVGRRGGKSLLAAFIAVYLAVFRQWRSVLAPGERGVVMVICPDRRQSRVIFRYVLAFFDRLPALGKLVERRTAEALYLTNGIVIEVHTASFRSTRGYTVVAAILDEVAFLRDETSANPDVEILNALRPATATVPGALILGISSPYARRGVLWEAYRQHYGRDGDPVLVWQAGTRDMNPTVDAAVIEAALEQDEAAARAEYFAEFRRDVETFVPREAVDAVIIPNRRELAPVAGVRYVAFVDPSGGSQDSMTLAVAHAERRQGGRVAVLDCLRERRPPFSPEAVVAEFAALLGTYHVHRVTGDRYAGEWPRERFRKLGIGYEVAEQAKSDIYRDLLPYINSGRVELLDERRLVAQLCGLERRTARSGKDSIDHGPHGHDDLVNAAAGALVLAAGRGAHPGAAPVGVGALPVHLDTTGYVAATGGKSGMPISFGPSGTSHWRGR